jgi:predicted type IV restriction endonuclease
MAFEDDFARYIDQLKLRLPHIRGEEATKQSLVIPLFHVLGYDVWNPLEVQPEYGADFNKGPKKGQIEKVDYALKINGEPVVFVECKAAEVALDTHDGQLARYFNATPSVRVGILTNGVRIKVFTDLQQPNVMDEKPWMDFDLRSAKQAEIDALKKFRKTEFTADQIVGLAEEMVYYNVLVPFIASQLRDPGEKLVRLVAEEIPSIKRIDKKVVDRLTPILRKAIQSAILDHVARSFGAPTQSEPTPVVTAPTHAETTGGAAGDSGAGTDSRDGILTTAAELEVHSLVSKMIKEKFPDAVVQYRDAKSYFTIMQKNLRKWFIRLGIEKAPYWISFRHIKPEAARVLCPGIEVVDGGQLGDAEVAIKGAADVLPLKRLILASYEAELARIGDPADSADKKASNSAMLLTSTLTAQGVLRPPCLLGMLAADCHVVQAPKQPRRHRAAAGAQRERETHDQLPVNPEVQRKVL